MKKQLLALLLCLLALLLLVACGPDTPVDPDGPSDPSDPANVGKAFDLSATTEYVVVVNEYASNQEKEAGRVVRNAIEAAHGAKPKISSDWLTGAPSKEEVAARVEVLIGKVDRPETKELRESLNINGFIVTVKGNKLILLGASDDMTLEAAKYFASQILYDEGGMAVSTIQSNFSYTKSYDPVLVETVYDTSDVVVANAIVTDFPYLADPTGKEDSTKAIQQALDDVYAQGGGTVFMPVGQYLVTGTITVPQGCMLRGDWQNPDTADALAYGTVILAKTPELDEKYLADRTRSPLFSLDNRSTLEGVTVFYPDQDINNVKKYGYTVYSQAPSCTNIRNITLLNSYRGIGVDVHAQESHELVQINDIYMTVLEMGYEEYHSTDVGNIVGVSISPSYWANAGAGYACSDTAKLAAYCKQNTIGLQINGLDDTHISGLRLESLRTAVYMPTGHSTHDYWGVIYDVVIKDCINGFVIESLNGYGGAAIAKATIDAERAAIYSAAQTGALKLCDVTAVNGDIVAVGGARIYEDFIDVSEYNIVSATYQKPAAKLYVAPILGYSKVKQDVSSLIQATLDEAGKTGGIVYIPAGVYSVYKTLKVPAGVELRGAVTMFMTDSTSGSDGIQGTVLLTYVEDDATVTLAENAGINGIRIFCAIYSPEDSKIYLEVNDRIAQKQTAVKGEGNGVYARNLVVTGTFNGVDFTGCDNHSVKHMFGAVFRYFIMGGGKNGVVEQCLSNQHFLNRQHFLTGGYMDSKYYTGWSMDSEMTATFRDEVRRVYGIMVYLEDAENETVSNIFTYGPSTLVLCDNSSATLINTSSDFHGMGPMFDVKNGSDVVAVNALRSANESLRCDESSDFKLINRISISRFNEPSFDSAEGNVDEIEYTVIKKDMINDGSKSVGSVELYTGSEFAKTGNTALYHAASPNTVETATIYSQTFSPISVDPYMNEDGYLHMWVYIEDMTSALWDGWITLSGANGSLKWSNICYITHNGWNEVWLPLTGANGTLSGKATSLTVTDKRSIKKQHSDYYFDDIYLCVAESKDADANDRVESYDVAPTPDVSISALPGMVGEDNKITLLSCDSLYNNQARSSLAYVISDPEFVKEGSGSWKITKSGRILHQIKFASLDLRRYMENGYLHLWVYVENAAGLNGAFELSSAGEADKQEISWHVQKHVIKNGWNELILPLNAPDSSTGDFSPRGANFFRFYIQGTGNVTVYIDGVTIEGYAPLDLSPEEIVENSESFACTAFESDEGKYLEDTASQKNTTTMVRFADNSRSFMYVYHVRDFSKLQAVKWTAPISGQLLLSVSTDGQNFTEVYRYVGDAGDQGLDKAFRTYNLTDAITEKSAKRGEIYVKISDAYTESGYGGAINNTAPITATLYYVPVDTSEWGAEDEGGAGQTPTTPDVGGEDEIPDVLPATEKHVFLVSTASEQSYLLLNDRSSFTYGKRFSDNDRSFAYGYTIYDFTKLTELTWTATVGQQLHLSVSTDGESWTDVYLYNNEQAQGLPMAERSYDLLPLIDRTSTEPGKVYIRVTDSSVEDGWGGAVSGDAPVTLKVAYEGGEGDVVKGMSEQPESKDPEGKLVAETFRPEGEVKNKLVAHSCESIDGSLQQYVPVSLNTNPAFVKEGNASWKREGMTNEYIAFTFEPLDVSDYMANGYLHLWVYVSDYNLRAGGQIELTSSGHADANELHWEVTDYIKGTGWNEIFIPLSEGLEQSEAAPFDPTCASFIRIFAGTTDGKFNTMYFDDIYFCTME